MCLETVVAPAADRNLAMLKQLEDPMNESQTSCSDDFKSSPCEELDEFVRLTREAGAYGNWARLCFRPSFVLGL
ncbi:hypothetical protein K438DRAFT_1847145 [Mycena galopus ATCC 62051]|nr:hypothetical protein K438DRAFT_1847145 [Mycena galopus ATCC 62051]